MKKIVLSLLGLGLVLSSVVALFLIVGAVAKSELMLVVLMLMVVGLGVKLSPNKTRRWKIDIY